MLYNLNMENKIEVLQRNLVRRGFSFSFFEDEIQANDYILSLIPDRSSIGFGGSMTVKEMGLLDVMIRSEKFNLLHRDICKDVLPNDLYRKMHAADWYICSTNALCMTGDLVNIDGRANRVAAMLNGPKNVIIVCGINKVVSDIQEGIDRTRNIASPPNCRRLNKKTPCAVTGKCMNCNSTDTICRATVIQHHPTSDTNVHIVLINKEFGF